MQPRPALLSVGPGTSRMGGGRRLPRDTPIQMACLEKALELFFIKHLIFSFGRDTITGKEVRKSQLPQQVGAREAHAEK